MRLDPKLLAYDNVMEEFLVEFRRKNLHIAPHREQEKPRILLVDEPKITAPLWFKVFFVVMYAAAIGVVIWALSNIHF